MLLSQSYGELWSWSCLAGLSSIEAQGLVSPLYLLNPSVTGCMLSLGRRHILGWSRLYQPQPREVSREEGSWIALADCWGRKQCPEGSGLAGTRRQTEGYTPQESQRQTIHNGNEKCPRERGIIMPMKFRGGSLLQAWDDGKRSNHRAWVGNILVGNDSILKQ